MKLLLRLIALAPIVLGVSTAAHAQATADPPRGNISGFGVYTANASDELDRGHGFGISGAWFFARSVGVEGGFRRQAFDLTGSDANALSGGELNANVITLNVVGRFVSGSVQPYVSGGAAFVSSDYTIDDAVAQQLAAFNFSAAESVDSAIGFNVGGGVDFQASERFGFFVEGRFLAVTADTVGGLTDTVTQISAETPGEQELNVFTVAGGIRILF